MKHHDDLAIEQRCAHSTLTTRRHFLAVVSTGAAAALAGCSGASGGVEPEAFGDVSGGSVAELPVGTIKAIPGVPAAVGRDAGGVYALTLTCTHNGCTVTVVGIGTNASFSCPCHGSKFDKNGDVTQGPAADPLVHFAVDIDAAGNITVHGGMRVDATIRHAVA
jgi:nitrite reductase/ring-hydroxylating ferredoxin subunit